MNGENTTSNNPRFTSHVTKDYSVFKIPNYQRELNTSLINILIDSIDSFGGQIQPVTVDVSGYVIDGQHRLEALKALGMPVWYVINHALSEEEISSYACRDANNVSNKWKLMNYANWAIHNGNDIVKEAEAIAREWSEATGNRLTVGMALELLNGDPKRVSKSFNDLTYKIDYETAKNVFDFANALYPNMAGNPFCSRMIRPIKKLCIEKNGLDVRIANKMTSRKNIKIYGAQQDNYDFIKELYEKCS